MGKYFLQTKFYMKQYLFNTTDNKLFKHFSKALWGKVNLLMLKKMIGEFSHELLLRPKIAYDKKENSYVLASTDGRSVYQFKAMLLELDHWEVDSNTISLFIDGNPEPTLTAVKFIGHFKDKLGLNEPLLSTYLEEIMHCLYGMMYNHCHNSISVEKLVEADYQTIEKNMLMGHPCFIANSAKIGYDIEDYSNYAPEAADPFSLIWLAGFKGCTKFENVKGFEYKQHIERELSLEVLASFNSILTDKNLEVSDFIYFPVHPWQWYNKLVHLFAPEFAANRLVLLGSGKDKYLPQQSIRTMFNISNPNKCYVKSALSILNMGFMRGISPYFMRATPKINEWISNIVLNDPFLQEKKFTILREVATVGFTNKNFEEAFSFDTAYKKMLASLWRESPYYYVNADKQLMTMAALLHVDSAGDSFLPALIKKSDLTPKEWLYHYLDAYLTPLLHCYYQYDIRFMPHGENVILVLDNYVPTHILIKDIGEEIAVLDSKVPLPEELERIRIKVPEELRLLSIFTQAFDCYFRFLNAIIVTTGLCEKGEFWELTARVIQDYQERFSQNSEKFERYNLFTKEIPKTCLNRLQLRDNKKMIDGDDPFKKQQFAGNLTNPLYGYQLSLNTNK